MTSSRYICFFLIWNFLTLSQLSCVSTSGDITRPSASPVNTIWSPTSNPTKETEKDEAEAEGKFTRSEGWPLPNLEKWTKTKPRLRKSRQGTVWYETSYEPKVSDSYILSLKEKGNTEAWSIYSLKVVEMSNRTYGYIMVGAKVTLDADGNVKYRVATSRGIQVYDDDGDGIFETAKFSGLNEPLPKILH